MSRPPRYVAVLARLTGHTIGRLKAIADRPQGHLSQHGALARALRAAIDIGLDAIEGGKGGKGWYETQLELPKAKRPAKRKPPAKRTTTKAATRRRKVRRAAGR
jgi:hypothetical protein